MPCCIQTLLMKQFSVVERGDRMDLILKGRPTPDLPGLEMNFDGKLLNFDTSMYVKHDWLCGSEALQAVFCWPCLLFASDRISYWTKLGYRELTSLTKATATHEESIGHIRSRFQYAVFVSKNIPVEKPDKVKAPINSAVARNHRFLKSVINSVFFLGKLCTHSPVKLGIHLGI